MTVLNEQLVLDAYGPWKASHVAYLTSLTWKADNGGYIELGALVQPKDEASTETWPQSDGSWYAVILAFSGIRDLEAKHFGSSPLQVLGFDIIDIRDRGIEGASYIVEDYEEDLISFHCQTASIVSVSAHEGPNSINPGF